MNNKEKEKIIKYLAYADNQTFEFNNNDITHMLADLHLAINEIDLTIERIKEAIQKSQSWRDELNK